MEPTPLLYLYSIFVLFLGAFAFKLFRRKNKNIPPTPAVALPLIGHFHLIKEPLHRTLHKFSQKCGPIFSVRFGSRLVVVVSSPALADECFAKNDVVLANRLKFIIGKYIGYNYSSILNASYGDHWRNLRKLGANELFSHSRLNMFLSIRLDDIRRLVRNLVENLSQDFAKVEMKSKLQELSFNVIMRMMTGKRYFGEDEEIAEAVKFRELIQRVFEHSGSSNPADFIPLLRWIDYKGFEKSLVKLISKEMDVFLEGLIDEHRRDGKSNTTMVDHLLTLQESQPEYYVQ